MKTIQEVFDICVGGLLKQGVPAIMIYDDGTPGCWYRVPNTNNKCVVGQLFADDINTSNFDAIWVSSIVPEHLGIGSAADSLNKALLEVDVDVLSNEELKRMMGQLQGVHDATNRYCDKNISYREYWVKSFSDIADKYKLNKEVLKAYE